MFGCLLITPILPVYALNYSQKIGEINSIEIKNNDNVDRWAVIIGISDYPDDLYLLPSPAPNAIKLCNLLQEKDVRWNANNIKLLLNETATRQSILDALDWLITNADQGDVVLFTYNGHGTWVPDKPPFDELDFKDEVLCPYDMGNWDNPDRNLWTNYISDDELGAKFDEISAKNIEGAYLIFNSCYSGGLFRKIDWSTVKSEEILTSGEAIQIQNTLQAKSNGLISQIESMPAQEVAAGLNIDLDEVIQEWNTEVQEANNFTNDLIKDINANGRVILAASLPHSMSIEFGDENGEYISMFTGVNKAIYEGKTAAEDITRHAKNWWLTQPEIYKIMPLYFLISIVLWKEVGGWYCFPIPTWKDGYPASDPSSAKLSIIGDGHGGSQPQSTPQSQPQTQPSSQQSSEPISKTTIQTIVSATTLLGKTANK